MASVHISASHSDQSISSVSQSHFALYYHTIAPARMLNSGCTQVFAFSVKENVKLKSVLLLLFLLGFFVPNGFRFRLMYW